MKALRFFTIVLIAVLVMSVWGPAPVYAKSSTGTTVNSDSGLNIPLKTKLARLRVTNRTGGTLTVQFSGPHTYSFSTGSQGKVTFAPAIEPGKYVVTVTASACNGHLTYRRNVKGGTVSLPPFICRH